MTKTLSPTKITEALVLSTIKNNTTFKSKKKSKDFLKIVEEAEKGAISLAYACKMIAKGNIEEYLKTGEIQYFERAEAFKYWSIRMGADEWEFKSH